MKLSIGIVGLPNVGKSTLFKLITKQEVNIANYPFATIDPNVGIVPVPDERLEKLAKISNSGKIVPAVVEFYDIAGLVKGAYKGEGLGNKFLSHIRETSAIVLVIRCFKNDEIIHIEGGVDPLRDLEILETELALKDLETMERYLHQAEKDTRSGNKEASLNKESANAIKNELEKGNILFSNKELVKKGEAVIRETCLLSAKPQIILLNGSEEDVSDELKNKIKEIGAEYVITDLSKEQSVSELIKKSYKILHLISFLTSGEMETRAWTIQDGMKAPQASGVIHTDFEKNFIKAEVIDCDKFIEFGGWQKAKQKGLVRLEGKEYVVKDGDVIIVKHG